MSTGIINPKGRQGLNGNNQKPLDYSNSLYKIDKSLNSVVKIEKKRFSDLKIRERENLQEWIADNPDMLGEDLLIIQKEFNGFNDTHERLDLLALDKKGGLVIIENKLDDSGRDVVWQALKYASYCSTLTNAQVIKIYQDYLNKYGKGENAKESLLDFLERDEEELLLNRVDQRIIFVANNYRKEVTSTVLWLLKHDILIQCFRATPYAMDEDTFLQVEQIIPLPETKEFIIDANEKEREEKSKSKIVSESESNLIEFWGNLKENLKANNENFIENVSSSPYYSIGFWKGQGKFSFCIGKSSYRVELCFQNDPNNLYIDAMAKYKSKIDELFDGKIEWEKPENKKVSRIKYEMPVEYYKTLQGDFSNKSSWEGLIKWYRDSMAQFYYKVYPIWEEAQKDLVGK